MMGDFATTMEGDKINDSKEVVKNVNIVSEWLIKFDSNTLTESDFWNYWKTWVPKISKPVLHRHSLEWSFNEQKAQQTLFDILEEFICNGNSIKVLRDLTQQNYPSSVCCRVFKIGEPVFNCQECGMDSACVLCVDCFKQSPHKNHKYKMRTISDEGGSCDCGDVEAWKQDAYCQTHKLSLQKKQFNLKFLTHDVEKRARLVFKYVLRYAFTLLTSEHFPILPADSDEHLLDDLNDIYKNHENSFCIVLYNDMTYTKEQIITILIRFFKYSRQESINYVTCIYQDGRAVVKWASLECCNALKKQIENLTSYSGKKPMEIVVVHSFVIAHQIYALRLLTWLQQLLGYSERLRAVFSEVILASTSSKSCIIESIWRKDTALWKLVRLHWYKLLIAGMFIEYDNKKEFAKVFTKNYDLIMNDFVKGTHCHSCSVSSLGKQIFTVPSLANYLMAHHNVLFKLLHTFSSIFSHKRNKQGKLEFDLSIFKRAQYILDDICYLLHHVPTSWNTELRESFSRFVFLVIKILSYLQNINTTNKKICPTMEYELKWGAEFNFHRKLRPLITKILLWCESDISVLKTIYNFTLKKVLKNQVSDPQRPSIIKELTGYKVTCIDYDVLHEPVCIHLPLSRFFAGLYLNLVHHGLHLEHSELQTVTQSPKHLIEPNLRALVLTQVLGKMWREDGHSLLNQIHIYHNPESRMEMFDKDIVILQMGASLIDSNEFLIHLLNKFYLIEWAQPNFKSNGVVYKGQISLVEEFLNLIIIIVGERYTPSIGKVTYNDCIKKEVIQQLCVEPMCHSKLTKKLLAIVEDEEYLVKSINEVAILKKTKEKVVYELKPMYYDHYNVFFYHYTREEMFNSEEEQKKRRKAAGELECCPPPSLPLFSDAFANIINIMQCDVMLYIMKLILDRIVNFRSSNFSECQLHKVLHLIGYALHEEENQQSALFTFTERSKSYGIEVALDKLTCCPRVELYKDLAIWTLNKFKQVSTSRRINKRVKSKIAIDKESVKNEGIELEKVRSRLVAERKANVMAQMAQMQNNFIKENTKLFENTPTYSESHKDSVSIDILENTGKLPVALGPYQTSSSTFDNRYTCILCQEEQLVTNDCQAMVFASYVQKSSVLCQVRNNSKIINNNVSEPYYIPANFGPSPHVSTCGHVMHVACLQKHFNIIHSEEIDATSLVRLVRMKVQENEYLCPLCEGICNTYTPLLPPISSFTKPENMKTLENLTFENWLEGLNMALKQNKIIKPKATEKPTKINKSLSKAVPKVSACNNSGLSSSLVNSILEFTYCIYSKATNIKKTHPDNNRIPLMTWKACAYTIHSIEVVLRYKKEPLLGEISYGQKDCLGAMVHVSRILSSIWKNDHEINLHALQLLSLAIDNGGNNSIGILDWDAFGMLVSLTMALPSLYNTEIPRSAPKGTMLEFHILLLMLTANLVQIILTIDIEGDSQEVLDMDPKETEDTYCIANLVYKLRGISIKNTAVVWKLIENCSIPFLRCCCLFYHFLTRVPASKVLTEVNGDTYHNMCCYLGLPTTCRELLDKPYVEVLINKWTENKKLMKIKQGEKIPFRVWTHINELVQLPDDYSELINTKSMFICPNSRGRVSGSPAMCLVCGAMMCFSSNCCQSEIKNFLVGACSGHTYSCGCGFGIFLRVRESELFILAPVNKGSVISSPYLDQYGETDGGLKRGNPLYLCKEQYHRLQLLWLGHKIQEELYRFLDSSDFLFPTNWQLV